jgi:Rrf2 family protein
VLDVILSQTAIYALKAVLHLAETEGDELARVDDIAQALDVPRNYLSKILHVLAREGVLSSTRGPRGGFRLAVGASDLTLERVVDPFDEVVAGSGCLLGREQCTDQNPCAAHARWKGVSTAVRAFFKETTVEALSKHGQSLSEGTS